MIRKIMQKLLAWKSKTQRKPLLVYGARQVGKTYIIKEFGKQYYENVVYLNFEINQDASSFFESNIEPERIILFLETLSNQKIIPGKTLIFFDEIQICQRALTSLKYFEESNLGYDIVAAGSLLGLAIDRENISFPVGKVDSLKLQPLDFEEFLYALGKENLANTIRLAFDSNQPLPDLLHQQALDCYKKYLIVGGMPGVVAMYLQEKNFFQAQEEQMSIIDNYTKDMSKYSDRSESTRIHASYNSIPAQLGKDNKKFQYKLVQKGGTASIFGSALNWLFLSKVVLKCERIEQPMIPLVAYRDLSSFKLYLNDVGLLTKQSSIPLELILRVGEFDNMFLGSITENYVAQSLVANNYDLFYWCSNGIAEIDFLIQKGIDIIPIEVKTGYQTRSRSLNVYITKYAPSFSIRISMKNFGFENNVKSVPLYAVFCI